MSIHVCDICITFCITTYYSFLQISSHEAYQLNWI